MSFVTPQLNVIYITDIWSLIFQIFNDIQDKGLQVLAESCKKLKRLRIVLGPRLTRNENLTQNGLISLAQGCQELKHIEVFISTISNEALEIIGDNLKNLTDFRIVLTTDNREDRALTLDDGVRAVLRGCTKMRKLVLYLREGDISDLGMEYIGECSQNVSSMLLGDLGGSDKGLVALSRGCPKLQKLELRGCNFSEWAISTAVNNLATLRFLWAVAYKETRQEDLSIMTRPYWHIELNSSGNIQVPNKRDELVDPELLAYYSLVEERPYYPNNVLRFRPQ